MKPDPSRLEEVLQTLPEYIRQGNDTELVEKDIIEILRPYYASRTDAADAWERAAMLLRQAVVRRGLVYEWKLFRRVLRITKLPSADEMERISELYALSTPVAIDQRIRSLSGTQFEQFLAELLRKIAVFRDVRVTQPSRDGGIDVKGRYVPDERGPEWVLLGQAKQVVAPVSVDEARSFIGALDACGAARVFGLFVSTAGFTDPAHQALSRSRFHIAIWGLEEIRERVFECGLGLRRVDISLEMVDETFWDEVVGGA